jgi:hypothetical protein
MNAPVYPMGLHKNVPAAHYHADASVSNSMLTAINKTPAHCYGLYLDPHRPANESTPAMRAGTLMHTAVLEQDQLLARYAIKPEGMSFATKDGKAWRETVPDGVEIITTEAAEQAQMQRAAIWRVPVLAKLLSHGYAESSCFWEDEATGLRCRARPDWIHPTGPKSCVVLDLKSIDDLTHESVQRAIARYGYHRQQAHYRNGVTACGLLVEEFVFGFVSSSYPYLAAALVLDDESAGQGQEEVAELLAKFKGCRDLGFWPAFGDGYQQTSLPIWARRSQELEVSYAD